MNTVNQAVAIRNAELNIDIIASFDKMAESFASALSEIYEANKEEIQRIDNLNPSLKNAGLYKMVNLMAETMKGDF